HYLALVAEVLPKAFDDEAFDFYGRTLNGQQQQKDRWKRAVASVDQDLGEAVGELYVQRYFPPASRQKVLDLVENLRASYAERIAQEPWMTPATKKVALQKLAAFHPKIGYPDRWRDYSALSVVKGDAFGNATRGAVFEWNRRVKRMGGPTDRGEWGMTPQTINAYYNATFNEVVFPAAILQPPFFDPNADPAVNYGGIGGVIGHEMTHGYDDEGRKFDGEGALADWWTAADKQRFEAEAKKLNAQYDTYSPYPGVHVKGDQTAGENIADLGGLLIALDAYHHSLGGAPAPVIDGLTGDQRFFLAYAQSWRDKYKEDAERNYLVSDVHSPEKYRV
ncbi:MAG: M13-type metalloendopeptidase, partial [Steroidobacteraceae bacterium]